MARGNAVVAAILMLLVLLTGLLIADVSIFGVHLLDVVALVIIAFLWRVVFGALIRR